MTIKSNIIINTHMDITYADTMHYIIDVLNDTKNILNIKFEDPKTYSIDIDMASKYVKYNDKYYNLMETPIILISYDSESDDLNIVPYIKEKYELYPSVKFRNQAGFIFYDRSDDSIYSTASNRMIYPKIINTNFNYINISNYNIFNEDLSFDRWDQIILYLQERFTEYININIDPTKYDVYPDNKTMFRMSSYVSNLLPVNKSATIVLKTNEEIKLKFFISLATFTLSPELYYISFNKENIYELSEFSDENGTITLTIDNAMTDIYIIPKELKRIYMLNTVQRLNDVIHLNIVRTK